MKYNKRYRLMISLVVLGVDNYVSRAAHEPLMQRNRAAVLVLATAVITEPAWTLSEEGLKAAAQPDRLDLCRHHGHRAHCGGLRPVVASGR